MDGRVGIEPTYGTQSWSKLGKVTWVETKQDQYQPPSSKGLKEPLDIMKEVINLTCQSFQGNISGRGRILVGGS